MVMHTYSPQLSFFGSCIVASTAAVGLLGKRTRRTKRVNIFFFFTLGRLDDLLPLMICRRIQQSFLCWHTHLWRKNKEKSGSVTQRILFHQTSCRHTGRIIWNAAANNNIYMHFTRTTTWHHINKTVAPSSSPLLYHSHHLHTCSSTKGSKRKS